MRGLLSAALLLFGLAGSLLSAPEAERPTPDTLTVEQLRARVKKYLTDKKQQAPARYAWYYVPAPCGSCMPGYYYRARVPVAETPATATVATPARPNAGPQQADAQNTVAYRVEEPAPVRKPKPGPLNLA